MAAAAVAVGISTQLLTMINVSPVLSSLTIYVSGNTCTCSYSGYLAICVLMCIVIRACAVVKRPVLSVQSAGLLSFPELLMPAVVVLFM